MINDAHRVTWFWRRRKHFQYFPNKNSWPTFAGKLCFSLILLFWWSCQLIWTIDPTKNIFRASNNNISAPVTTKLQLDMTRKLHICTWVRVCPLLKCFKLDLATICENIGNGILVVGALSVALVQKGTPLIAGRSYTIHCQVKHFFNRIN